MTTDPSNPDALDRGPSDPPDPKERAEEAASRDEGPGLFGDDAPRIGAAQPYRVLARKYRPRRFEDLIGQEAMVRVLESAFKSGRIAHAFILTGVRGVGKTTTARLIARALNYTGDGADAPSLAMDTEGQHCAAIAASSHPDVIEMDAASRTGIGDVREIIDSVRYHPVSARYKVYIIDEVHMLSTAAFNGLLKTLEEPPPHCKFIFATTEIRKVPVTVLSRCQRFDLKRVRQEVLADHLAGIAKTEGAEIEDRALALIARASEGSVRDALSLLDQAITLAPAGQTVSSLQVQDMLGLSDRGRTIDLFTDLMAGQVRPALDCLRTLYDHGADPQLIVSDLLEFTHWITRIKVAASDTHDASRSEDEITRGRDLASRLSLGDLSRAWQILMKGLEEMRHAPQPIAAAEMVLIRLVYARDLPSPGDLARKVAALEQTGGPAALPGGTTESPPRSATHEASVPAPPPPPASAPPRANASPGPQATARTATAAAPVTAQSSTPAWLASFDALLDWLGREREVRLKFELEHNASLVRFEYGRIELALREDADANLPVLLAKTIKEAGGGVWMVSVSSQKGGETRAERAAADKAAALENAKHHPLVAATLKHFPDATVRSVKPLAPTETIAEGDMPAADNEDADDRNNEGTILV